MTVRLLGALCLAILVIVGAFAFGQIREERERLHRDLERHDGMNLVAKEFVSVRDDEDGVLVLSRFTGAARELRDAFLVNPYDLDGTAEAIRAALELPVGERRARMRRMRQWVREHNVYRWAGLLLSELARIPADAVEIRA